AVRAVQGLAGGFMVPQVFGIIRSSFAPAMMAKAFGAYGAVQGLASVAGPLLGGALVDADLWGLGWRTIFWINIPVAVVALALGARVLPESHAPVRARLDLVGAALAAVGVLLVLLPLVQGRDWGWPAWGWALLVAGVALLAGFLGYERAVARRGGEPVLDPALLSVRPFTSGLAASVLFFGGLASFFLVLSIYLQAGTGRSAWDTGLVILPYAIGSMITSGAGVALAAKAGRALLVTGSLTLAASQALLWWLVRDGATPGYWSLAAAMFLGGLGLGLSAPILVNVVLAGVPGRQAGAAGGVLSTVNQIGGAVGVAVLGTVFFNALSSTGSTDPAEIFGHALARVMPWQVATYLLAAAAMLALPKTAAAHQT
ncbi:MFS transporter, partial [Actinoplanes missouriensis]|uniref:MFS transporter n=1 Tax=Actinoplanes missouriensis TaxID=1866 RepID=UPI0033E318A7